MVETRERQQIVRQFWPNTVYFNTILFNVLKRIASKSFSEPFLIQKVWFWFVFWQKRRKKEWNKHKEQ